ncbi:MAG: hypothetical protein A2913_01345 [Parcubacteria group bacterium RIFCSPLOWO2_01_FULL_40_65]|nr:MAG: hypothetical protein A2734_01350 [Parcubacteria group bacterium RIFCSPHIGHO2_01_FULL_40_30]OHB19021.1 MAG: hypothetical protein A3D40_01130 [Parcubacteria group bacterium RIFCSPHIGHO2_02_FULL_40_12]OHB22287.1 MAG: hypothetical protein A2913_01345 [Parcubacteria group bacterium RIFCSPLOWO2_01_FULL_40_65]OHB23647.1 MAG: hypothetical protein A3I22_01175 [Parcubacteria group bacterium RIFCSPLOWO2_02_FULL_40_12]OHB24269.1 MAG: hypothetical protein A3F96_00145 [Parcubacteria group bacterium R
MKLINFNKLNIEQGSVLVYTILTIGVVLSIVFTLTSIFASKLKITSNYSDSITALYAAESGIEWQIYNQLKNPDANQPVLTNGATFTLITPSGTLPIKVIGKFRGISRSEEISL